MKRDEILKIAREEIFEKMHEFNYINNIEVIDDVREDSNLSSDLAMDPFDLLEVLMGIEEKMDIRISDDVFGDKSVDELTVGIFVDMLYDWLEIDMLPPLK
jgi:acyl carrier protein